MGATEGIDAVLKKYDLDALVVPSAGNASAAAAMAGITFSSVSSLRIPYCYCAVGSFGKDWTTVWVVLYWDEVERTDIDSSYGGF